MELHKSADLCNYIINIKLVLTISVKKFGLLLPEELWVEIIQAVHNRFLK